MKWIKRFFVFCGYLLLGLFVIRVIFPILLFCYFSPPAFILALKPRHHSAPNNPPVFDGTSSLLKSTQVLATLDDPLPKGKNAIWCASFEGAWKELQDGVVHGPISLEGNPPLARALNSAIDLRSQISANEIYTAAGWTQKGIIEQIQKEMAQKFPSKSKPEFPGSSGNALIAYAYIETNVPFSYPYFQNRKPLVFTDSSGKQTELSSFGIREEDEYAYYSGLRRQPEVLYKQYDDVHEYSDWKDRERTMQFALDLCISSLPNQIILARVNPEPTLAATIKRLDAYMKGRKSETLGPRDVVLVPDIYWKISHRFTELENRPVQNQSLGGLPLVVAQEDMVFRLDRNGAELKAESQMHCFPTPSHFVFDRPFLLYIKKRGADDPFFVMWVDNAELLTPW